MPYHLADEGIYPFEKDFHTGSSGRTKVDTLKTAVVVALLLAVLYGAWVVLNGDPNQQPYMPGGPNWPADTGPAGPSGPPVEIGNNSLAATGFPSEAPIVPANPQQPFVPLNLDNNSIPPNNNPIGSNRPIANAQNGNSLSFPPAANIPTSGNPPLGNPPLGNDLSQAPPIGFPTIGDPSTDPTSPQFGVRNPNPTPNNLAPAAPDFSGLQSTTNGLPGKTIPPTEDPMWVKSMEHIEGGRWHEALFTLSLMHKRNDLTPQRHQEILQLLNPLAAKVIYSREHLVEPAYRVVGNESLQSIAQQFKVPWQLLANINGIGDPTVVLQGTELKVLRGPFSAEVDLNQGNAGRLTLYAGRLYAGQFDVTSGNDPAPTTGKFQVIRKEPGRNYFVQGGQAIPAGHATNPYGSVYIDLGQFSIHGSSQTATLGTVNLGCISLSPKDAEDVYEILSEGSDVVIRR